MKDQLCQRNIEKINLAKSFGTPAIKRSSGRKSPPAPSYMNNQQF